MIAISASGAFSKFETTVLITQGELLKALELDAIGRCRQSGRSRRQG